MTSIGAWQPIVEQPESGSGGVAAAAAVGGSAASAGRAGTAGDGEDGGNGGAPDSPGVYLEAEDGELTGSFSTGTDAAASNGQFIQSPASVVSDMPGEALARYMFEVSVAGTFKVWGRIWSPDITSNRFWVQVDDTGWHRWRITVGTIWYWDDWHEELNYDNPLKWDLGVGTHQLQVAAEAANAKLDRLYVTSAGDRPPGNDTECRPPHSIDVGGECLPSCGSQAKPPMRSTCQCDGKPTFYAYDCASMACCDVP